MSRVYTALRLEEIERQAEATRARPLWRLPAAWYEPGCAERMAAWIERFVPDDERAWFTYGIDPESSPVARLEQQR